MPLLSNHSTSPRSTCSRESEPHADNGGNCEDHPIEFKNSEPQKPYTTPKLINRNIKQRIFFLAISFLVFESSYCITN